MPTSLESAIVKIREVGNEFCENQMYGWPGFDPTNPDPAEFFATRGIEFDGDLFIRYPARATFVPIPLDQIESEERFLEVKLPNDYKTLLQLFGEFHLPGRAGIRIRSPLNALEATRFAWCYEGSPLTALAVSSYNETSDGNSLGFIRKGNLFQSEIFEFDHELYRAGDAPALWCKKVGDGLAEFLVEYLARTQ